MKRKTPINTETMLLRNANELAQRMIKSFQVERPDEFAAVAVAFSEGKAKFDFRIRDVVGADPCIELWGIVALPDGPEEGLIGTFQLNLRKGEPSDAVATQH